MDIIIIIIVKNVDLEYNLNMSYRNQNYLNY